MSQIEESESYNFEAFENLGDAEVPDRIGMTDELVLRSLELSPKHGVRGFQNKLTVAPKPRSDKWATDADTDSSVSSSSSSSNDGSTSSEEQRQFQLGFNRLSTFVDHYDPKDSGPARPPTQQGWAQDESTGYPNSHQSHHFNDGNSTESDYYEDQLDEEDFDDMPCEVNPDIFSQVSPGSCADCGGNMERAVLAQDAASGQVVVLLSLDQQFGELFKPAAIITDRPKLPCMRLIARFDPASDCTNCLSSDSQFDLDFKYFPGRFRGQPLCQLVGKATKNFDLFDDAARQNLPHSAVISIYTSIGFAKQVFMKWIPLDESRSLDDGIEAGYLYMIEISDMPFRGYADTRAKYLLRFGGDRCLSQQVSRRRTDTRRHREKRGPSEHGGHDKSHVSRGGVLARQSLTKRMRTETASAECAANQPIRAAESSADAEAHVPTLVKFIETPAMAAMLAQFNDTGDGKYSSTRKSKPAKKSRQAEEPPWSNAFSESIPPAAFSAEQRRNKRPRTPQHEPVRTELAPVEEQAAFPVVPSR